VVFYFFVYTDSAYLSGGVTSPDTNANDVLWSLSAPDLITLSRQLHELLAKLMVTVTYIHCNYIKYTNYKNN